MLARSRSRFRGRVQAASFLASLARYGATDVWDFTTQQYIRGGTVGASGVTFTRASTGYAQRVDGRWELFGSGVPRITDQGLLIEGSRINRALYSRDLTNAAWTATNVTVARNQVGIDGTTNSACSLTATANNGTVLQAVTHASTGRYFSIWVKRLTGTGTVEVTLDNGSTWTGVTVTSGWTRVGAAQTVANPTVGVRLVTDTDAITVDFAQLEDGAFATSPIATEGTSVTRAADFATATLSGVNYPLSMMVEFSRSSDAGASEYLLATSDGTGGQEAASIINASDLWANTINATTQQMNISAGSAIALNIISKGAFRVNTNDSRGAINAELGTQDTSVTLPSAPNVVAFGSRPTFASFSFSYIRRAALAYTPWTDATLQAVTT